MLFNPGNIVSFHGRDWMVIPSEEKEVLKLKPVGGSDHEITGTWLPFYLEVKDNGIEYLKSKIDHPRDDIRPGSIPPVRPTDIGDFQTARLLFDASRLSFRNVSGPFRCMGKLSFRPRAYQVVPLVMALKQPVTRILIADDVGIGKTIEALIILKELLERGEIRRFAVVCPPHLCEQWHQELNDKLDIQAEIIRTSTAAALDRRLPDDRSVFYHFPYQVISIDYIKSDKRKNIFLNDCPDMIIVDEVHSCALPAGAKSASQQQRYQLLKEISENRNRHLLLLTATPHSGKNAEFQSILGLLELEFANYSLEDLTKIQKEKIADKFIQRKRENIRKWANQETPFPERQTDEVAYNLNKEYLEFYQDVVEFVRLIVKKEDGTVKHRARYWAALALLRGIMSSPRAGYEMLQKKQSKQLIEVLDIEEIENPVFEKTEGDSDFIQHELLEYAALSNREWSELNELSEQIKNLFGIEKDKKAEKALHIISQWVKEGFYPIVFCRYIETAKYIGEILKKHLPAKCNVQVITSELADEQRREEITILGNQSHRVLVATDCLSEGINLQEYFTAVLHYDLPWNPNRIEQRDGRVDRFNQNAKVVKSTLLWGEDNRIDAFVLRILLRKVREIQRSIGVNIPLAEDNQSIADAVLKEFLMEEHKEGQGIQLAMFAEDKVSQELEEAKKKAVQLRSIFAHSKVSQEDIETQLREVDEVIGDVQSVDHFVEQSLIHLGVNVVSDGIGKKFNPVNLPLHLQSYFAHYGQAVSVSFESPTPRGYLYIGRNHLFTEQLCQFILSLSFEGHPNYHRVARTAVIRTKSVSLKTTLVLFRVRNVIREKGTKQEMVSEEMYLWGYEGSRVEGKKLEYNEAKRLLKEAKSASNLSPEFQYETVSRELELFNAMEPEFIQLAERRAEQLVEAHGRFRDLVGGRRFEKVYPVLPPDILGIYILLPAAKTL